MFRGLTFLLALLCAACAAPPHQVAGPLEGATAAARSNRFALVIGNGNYNAVEALRNPPHDAEAVATSLRRLGFETNLVVDADADALARSVDTIVSQAAGADAVVLFYAGHAVNYGGDNYLLPVSASVNKRADLLRDGVGLDGILERLRGKAAATVVFLDACRDNPFKDDPIVAEAGPVASAGPHRRRFEAATVATRSIGNGLASVATASGMLIAFATAPGQVALDGDGDHSPFTSALLASIAEPNIEIRQMLGKVRRDVRNATDGRQIPWDNSSLESAFYLKQSALGGSLAGPTPSDGTWKGSSDLWKVTLHVSSGRVSGVVDSCYTLFNTHQWTPKGPAIVGVVAGSGQINAISLPKGEWSTRAFTGTFPNIRIAATADRQLNCPDGDLIMHPVDPP